MRPARTCRPFTPEENKQIETLFDEGKTVKQIAEIVGRTAGAVGQQIFRMRKAAKENDATPKEETKQIGLLRTDAPTVKLVEMSPRLYGRGDIHNRELRRRRIAHCRLCLLSFTESLALGNAGLSLYRETFPEKNATNFLGIGPHKGTKPSVRYKRLPTFPVKPSETPVFRTSPSKGYNPSTEPR